MFTVKVIEPNGSEKGFSVVKWVFIPKQKNSAAESLYLFRDDKSNVVDEVREGDVYIMNDNGKTVADYHFGEMKQEE